MGATVISMDLASPHSLSTAATAVATVDSVASEARASAVMERASTVTERAMEANSVVTANLVALESSATERAATDMALMANLVTVRSLLMANLSLPSTRSTTEKTKNRYKESYVHKNDVKKN